jgi:hypothetical protein
MKKTSRIWLDLGGVCEERGGARKQAEGEPHSKVKEENEQQQIWKTPI